MAINMETKIYKFMFSTPVHFGSGSLEETGITFCADTFFSALFVEACKHGADLQKRLFEAVTEGEMLFSDAFPFRQDTFYLPKPFKHIETQQQSGNSEQKKAFKKLKYVAMEDMESYLTGRYDAQKEMQEFGHFQMKTQAAIRGEDETRPYRVSTFSFFEDAGLYIMVSCRNAEDFDSLDMLIESLSYSGLGGKRCSGLGKFDFSTEEVPEEMRRRLQMEAEAYMTLSVAFPKDEELESILEGATYMLSKRSGFVASDSFSQEAVRKKDVFLFQAGSCFRKRFDGCILEVSEGRGTHPVFRYARPLFMGV